MVLDKSSTPNWLDQPPAALDIVTGFYPETNPKGDKPALRPCLVLAVLRNKSNGAFACRIAYGTKNLKVFLRQDKDLIIQNFSDLNEVGLPAATRFCLDQELIIDLPWTQENFGCWKGKSHPRIGALTLDYHKELAWLMSRER